MNGVAAFREHGTSTRHGPAVLYRVVLYLLSMAELAERAAGASASARAKALWALHIGDAAVREFVSDWFFAPDEPGIEPVDFGCEPEDAAALALSLRLLASIVWLIAVHGRRSSFQSPNGNDDGSWPRHPMDLNVDERWLLARASVAILDTS